MSGPRHRPQPSPDEAAVEVAEIEARTKLAVALVGAATKIIVALLLLAGVLASAWHDVGDRFGFDLFRGSVGACAFAVEGVQPDVSQFMTAVLACCAEGPTRNVTCLVAHSVRPSDPPCGCPILCRGWSGGISVLVDEAVAAG